MPSGCYNLSAFSSIYIHEPQGELFDEGIPFITVSRFIVLFILSSCASLCCFPSPARKSFSSMGWPRSTSVWMVVCHQELFICYSPLAEKIVLCFLKGTYSESQYVNSDPNDPLIWMS